MSDQSDLSMGDSSAYPHVADCTTFVVNARL